MKPKFVVEGKLGHPNLAVRSFIYLPKNKVYLLKFVFVTLSKLIILRVSIELHQQIQLITFLFYF